MLKVRIFFALGARDIVFRRTIHRTDSIHSLGCRLPCFFYYQKQKRPYVQQEEAVQPRSGGEEF